MHIMPHRLPLNFHIDGAQVLNNMEVEVVSWGSALVSSGVSWDTKLLMLLVPTECWVKTVTNVEVVGYLDYEVGIILEGVHPRVGYYLERFAAGSVFSKKQDQLIANGWKGAFGGNKFDMKAKVDMNNMRKPFMRNYCSNFVCELDCSCKHLAYLSYAHVKKNAVWKTTRISTADYIRTTRDRGKPYSPYVHIKGWALTRNFNDWLHSGQLGTGGDLAASSIRDMLVAGDLGQGNAEDCMHNLWLQLEVWKGRVGKGLCPCTMPMFDLCTIGLGKSLNHMPELGTKIKAYGCKVLCLFLAHKAIQLAEAHGGARRQLVATCLWCWAEVQRVWDKAGDHLTAEEAEAQLAAGQSFLEIYTNLAQADFDNGIRGWKLRPKFHSLQHTFEYAYLTRENPVKHMCFIDEDFMGKVKKNSKNILTAEPSRDAAFKDMW